LEEFQDWLDAGPDNMSEVRKCALFRNYLAGDAKEWSLDVKRNGLDGKTLSTFDEWADALTNAFKSQFESKSTYAGLVVLKPNSNESAVEFSKRFLRYHKCMPPGHVGDMLAKEMLHQIMCKHYSLLVNSIVGLENFSN
jgi:hypothetical protein